MADDADILELKNKSKAFNARAQRRKEKLDTRGKTRRNGKTCGIIKWHVTRSKLPGGGA
jgi:prophage antirepressor-like protein